VRSLPPGVTLRSFRHQLTSLPLPRVFSSLPSIQLSIQACISDKYFSRTLEISQLRDSQILLKMKAMNFFHISRPVQDFWPPCTTSREYRCCRNLWEGRLANDCDDALDYVRAVAVRACWTCRQSMYPLSRAVSTFWQHRPDGREKSQAMQQLVRDVHNMRLFLERKSLKSLGEDLSKSLHVECLKLERERKCIRNPATWAEGSMQFWRLDV